MHYIYVVRKKQTTESTLSEFKTSDGSLKGYFLERPGPDTIAENLRLRIPEGTYDLQWHTTSRKSIKDHNPLPILTNQKVPYKRGILIHQGNHASDSDGCLLAGTSKGENIVNASIPMLNKIKQYLKLKGIQNVKLVISSSYQG